MSIYRISWPLYIIGSLLVFGSWVGLVPPALAWIGWFVAMGGWFVGNTQKRKTDTRSRANEIANLNVLRNEGVLTEDEFRKEKERILREQ